MTLRCMARFDCGRRIEVRLVRISYACECCVLTWGGDELSKKMRRLKPGGVTGFVKDLFATLVETTQVADQRVDGVDTVAGL
ncbi:hypothetical protein PhaeoP75_03474 [Phaeobacter gallaeciensis]|uniref:Uncharacterized protein n=1 Tax=Phaeobacter gallaeciensis TaxID=60890 RepID=A0AAC9ZBZ7_9RHOB|nr:hypothetical protein Gal_03438 [Phaeobacter gallaeciensis DSM 26640]ATE94420.1 hypothetical protein PhaeoP11_03425 [Phaeobacter gallaeciensis]ATE98693.1 hypothetical protein PhaeoP73_03423 [Phaeobacter gallaeciensis]ATF03084.1 hypothetical protein PhaeoP75_03474 [Phaeobacter gallaeciensis]ATF07464.1 hypothetical protein PhaeoP63_03423 [Phaeobacter gallaeciensis]